MNPREKLLFVYLLTKPYVKDALEKFENEYKIMRYNSETNELALRNWGKYNLVRLGKPIEMCIEKELKGVSDDGAIPCECKAVREAERILENSGINASDINSEVFKLSNFLYKGYYRYLIYFIVFFNMVNDYELFLKITL